MVATAERLSASPPRRLRSQGNNSSKEIGNGEWAGSLRSKRSANSKSSEVDREISARAHNITERLSSVSPQRYTVNDSSHAAQMASYSTSLRSDAVTSGRMSTGKSEIPSLDELPHPREGIYGDKRYARAKSASVLSTPSRTPSPSPKAQARGIEGLAVRRGEKGGVSIPELMQFMVTEGHSEADIQVLVQSLSKMQALRQQSAEEGGRGDYALPELDQRATILHAWANAADAGTQPIRYPPDYGGFRGGRRRITEL